MDKLDEAKKIKEFLKLKINFDVSSWGDDSTYADYQATIDKFKIYCMNAFPGIKRDIATAETIRNATEIDGVIVFGLKDKSKENEEDLKFLRRLRQSMADEDDL